MAAISPQTKDHEEHQEDSQCTMKFPPKLFFIPKVCMQILAARNYKKK
jgi:hypothetical protein